MDIQVLSPLLPSDDRHGNIPSLVIVHSTAGRERPDDSAQNAIDTLRNRGLSYHYIVAKSGKIYKCVATSRTARHAGSSYGPREEQKGVSRTQYVNNAANRKAERVAKFVAGCSVNPYSIGISLVNMNDGTDPYPAAQIEAMHELIRALKEAIPTLVQISAHYEVSPKRKNDPRGPGFDLDATAAATGLAVWKFPDRAAVGRP